MSKITRPRNFLADHAAKMAQLNTLLVECVSLCHAAFSEPLIWLPQEVLEGTVYADATT